MSTRPRPALGTGRSLLRALAGLGAVGLALYGLAGLRRGEGRPAAAAVVVAAALVWFAATGSAPGWFRK